MSSAAANWDSAHAFFAMGGYGLYVWSAYAVAAVVLAVEPLLVLKRHVAALRQARATSAEGIRA